MAEDAIKISRDVLAASLELHVPDPLKRQLIMVRVEQVVSAERRQAYDEGWHEGHDVGLDVGYKQGSDF